jgi:hypothetical protein
MAKELIGKSTLERTVINTKFDPELENLLLSRLVKRGNPEDKLAVPNAVINRVLYQEILEEMPLSLDELPELDYEVSEEDRIGWGGEAKIYALGKSCAGKILHCPRPNSKDFYSYLLMETVGQELACIRGLTVPKVEGLFKIKRKEDGNTWPTLVMKKLNGFLTKYNENNEDSDFYVKLGEAEYNKAKSLGIYAEDFADNMFACPKEKKTYLIDSKFWKFDGVDFSEIKPSEDYIK